MSLVTIVPLASLGTLAIVRERRARVDDVVARLEAVAAVQEARIEAAVGAALERLVLVSAPIEARRAFDSLLAGGNPADREALTDTLLSMRDETLSLIDLSLTDLSGEVVVSTDPALIGSLPLSERELASGAPRVGPVHMNEDGQPVGAMTGPLEHNGRRIGFVHIVSDLSEFTSLVTDYTGLGATGETVLAARGDTGGARFVFPVRFDDEAPAGRFVSEEVELAEPMIVALGLSGDETAASTESKDYRGASVIAVSRRVPSLDWGLVLKMDRSEALAPVNRFTRTMFGGLAAVVLIVLVAAWLVAGSIAQRIGHVTDVAMDVTSGNVSRRATPSSSDEIALLARAFNDMTDWLVRANLQLEDKASELASSNEALSELEERFRTVFDNAFDPIFILDPEQDEFLAANPAACDLLGYRRQELLSLHPSAVFAEHEPSLAFFDSVHARGGAWTDALTCTTAGGSLLSVEITASPVELEGRAWVLAMARDVTERKRQEEALVRSTAELERHARELERVNEELSQLAYGIPHDLAEPVRMVSSYVGLLAHKYKNRLDEEATEFIDFALEGTARMRSLVDDLRGYFQIGREERRFQAVDCQALAEETVRALSPAVNDKEATVTIDSLPTVFGHPSELQQLLQNLVGNALKFTGPGARPRVRISAVDTASGWQFSVEDNGIGVAASHRERIFDMFTRLERRTDYAGTGIGLAICKKVVERHGGRIWVEPARNGGSIFSFTIAEEPGRGP